MLKRRALSEVGGTGYEVGSEGCDSEKSGNVVGGPSINLEERGGDRGEYVDAGAIGRVLGAAIGTGTDTGVDRDMSFW